MVAQLLAAAFLSACAQAEDLQRALDAAVQGRPGAAAVAEVRSGRLLAHYRLDVAATRLAPPGSLLKPFTLLALVEGGKAPVLACEPRVLVGGRRLDCSHPRLAIPVEPDTALAYSCNSYFAQVGLRLEAARFAGFLRRAGLASPTAWVPEGASGKVEQARSPDELQLQALGEDAILVTPLSLLAAYRRLALGWAGPILEGLKGATRYGSARMARVEGLEVAGKTGTATNRSRTSTHAWFGGFAPADDPQIVLVVFLEQGRGGASAAPVAKAVFEAWRQGRSGP